MKSFRLLITVCLFTSLLFSCKWLKKDESEVVVVEETLERPDFSPDSAYEYVAKQVAFGPRVPGLPAQKACFDYLKEKMTQFGAQVTVQEAKLNIYNGKEVPMFNLIASFNPDIEKRILLCAHWDSRPFADQDTAKRNLPIDGANDGCGEFKGAVPIEGCPETVFTGCDGLEQIIVLYVVRLLGDM